MDDIEELGRNYVKSLNIWRDFDKMTVELQKLEHELNEFSNEVKDNLKRSETLPSLNSTNKPIVLPSDTAQNDQDIVKMYKLDRHKGYIIIDSDKYEEYKKRAAHEPYADVTIMQLREKINVGEEVYVMVKYGKAWINCKVLSIFKKPARDGSRIPITVFRVKSLKESNVRTLDVDKFAIARDIDDRISLRSGKRVISGLTKSTMLSGIIALEPNDENKGRYMVLMDDGSARYFKPNQVMPIFGQTCYPWTDMEKLGADDLTVAAFNRYYYSRYPKRELIRIKLNEDVEILKNGTFVSATVIEKDCDIMRLLYRDHTEESVYRGSARLMRRTAFISQQLGFLKNVHHFDDGLLINLYLYEEASRLALNEDEDLARSICGMRITNNKARKSTCRPGNSQNLIKVDLDSPDVLESREVDEILMTDAQRLHKCSPICLDIKGKKTELEIKDIVADFRKISDLRIPLLYGWKRGWVKDKGPGKKKYKVIAYTAPCGKVFTKAHHLNQHLFHVQSKFDIDYFTFDRELKFNTSTGAHQYFTYLENIAKSKIGEPLENKFISLANHYSEEGLPVDFEYRSKRFPHQQLARKNFSFNPDFKSGCQCENDCSSKTNCSCMRLTEDSSGKPKYLTGNLNHALHYKSKRLESQVMTGIFECNSFCSCSSKCPNRVVQNGIRFRLQVQKTLGKGWGVVTLDDIPKGAFICTYAAELLDDADQYGDSDMYYADLDYIVQLEEIKLGVSDNDEGLGYESDEPVTNSVRKKKNQGTNTGDSDDDIAELSKKRSTDSSSEGSESTGAKYLPKAANKQGETRYPERKQPKRNCDSVQVIKKKPAKFLKIHEILESNDFTLDARMQGNVGRFFNHSCDPNAQVQNVFIETHDLRLPEVAFFAFRTIKALEEITWNYNYKMGAIEGRRIDCHCEASNCKGRIL